MAQQAEHGRLAASSPSRRRCPGAEGVEGSGSRRSVRRGAARSRRWSECRKSLQAPGFDRRRPPGCGGDCVQEEGGYEYASDHHGGKQGNEEAHIEPAILVQPLATETAEGETSELGIVPSCERGASGTCSRDAGGVGHSHGKKLWKALTHDERGSNKDAYCEATGGGLFISWIPGVAQITAVGCAFRGLELLLNG
jgi:hypothetical protein